MLDLLNNLVLSASDFLWGYVVIVLAVILGLMYGIRTRFIQIRHLPDMLRLVFGKRNRQKDGKGISSFQALCITLGGCIGTGNVAGVAMAIVVGGPGAVFWMWIIAILGAATSFIENTLAQVFKIKDESGFRGGPAYYMEKGLGKRWLGIIYALCMIVSLGFFLAALQTNTIAASFGQSFSLPPVAVALVVAGLIAVIIFGGVKRIAKVAEAGVPFMALLYIVMAVAIIAVNIQRVPEMLSLIFSSAFGIRPFAGATLGAVISAGLKRGVFSNGAGQGDAPVAGAAAVTSHPAKQGLMQSFAIYIDTLVVCTLTAFVVILSGSYLNVPLIGVELSQYAFASVLGPWASAVIAICIFLFCFTSIMSNYYCGESSLAYIVRGPKFRTPYRILFVIALFLGGITSVDIMWNFADLACALIVCINMISLLFLGGLAVKVGKDYTRQRKENLDPVFYADQIPGLKNADCWQRNQETEAGAQQ